jgi:hypothetical protein
MSAKKGKMGAAKASPAKKYVLNVTDDAVGNFLEARAKGQVEKGEWRGMTEEDRQDAALQEFRKLKELGDGGAGEFEEFQLRQMMMRRSRERARTEVVESARQVTPTRARGSDREGSSVTGDKEGKRKREGGGKQEKKGKNAEPAIKNLVREFGAVAQEGAADSGSEESSEEEEEDSETESESEREGKKKKKKGGKASERDLCQPWAVDKLTVEQLKMLAYDGRKDLHKRVCEDAKAPGRLVLMDKQGNNRKPHEIRQALYLERLNVMTQRLVLRAKSGKMGPKKFREGVVEWGLEIMEEVHVQKFYTGTAVEKGWAWVDAFEATMGGSDVPASIDKLCKKQDKEFEKWEKDKKEAEKEKQQKQQRQQQQQRALAGGQSGQSTRVNNRFDKARGSYRGGRGGGRGIGGGKSRLAGRVGWNSNLGF